MEFNEKLRELRKSRGLTQEELANALFVSRVAVSKWESGRGCPSIDSLKDISNFFSVSIDDLLSGDKLLSLAEKENKSNLRSLCDWLFGIVDLFSVMLVILPLYPETIDGYVYSVNLLAYENISKLNVSVYWILFAALILVGITKVILTKTKAEKGNKLLTEVSLVLGVTAVLFLTATRQAYSVSVAFLLLLVKIMIVLKRTKAVGN